MMRRLVRTAFSLVVVAAMVPGSVALAADPNLEHELRFRRDFGLNADVNFVRDLMANPHAYSEDYPVALTPNELAEMRRRLRMEQLMTPVELYAQRQPQFAGHWIDQANGGIIKVAFAGGGAAHRAELLRLAPADSTVELVEAEYTLRELEQVLQQLDADRLGLKAAGIWVRELGIDPRVNRVEVAVDELTEAAAAELRATYGGAIAVEQSGNPTSTACTDKHNCIGPPLRGGIAGGSGCSLAFLARKSGVGVGWLSAGHCAPVGTAWAHDGVAIGSIRTNCWPGCTYSDSLLGGYLNSTYQSYLVYRTATTTAKVAAVQGFDADDIGDQTCLNARRVAAWRCGVIDDIRRVDYGSVWFLEQRYATYAAYNGDSGGAVHSPFMQTQVPGGTSGVVAYGVQSGCEDLGGVEGCEIGEVSGRAIYSHIYRVRTELGVTVCSAVSPCP